MLKVTFLQTIDLCFRGAFIVSNEQMEQIIQK